MTNIVENVALKTNLWTDEMTSVQMICDIYGTMLVRTPNVSQNGCDCLNRM